MDDNENTCTHGYHQTTCGHCKFSNWADNLPERMKNLPRDERRKVPVPWMNEEPDGTPNFMAISLYSAVKAGTLRLCGICKQPLDYWIAFVGGPLSAANGVYTDPPFHKECAQAAMTLCPHIARKVHRRTADEKMPEGSIKSPIADESKPDQWIIGLTRDFKIIPHGQGVLFTCSVRHRIAYEYDERGQLQMIGGS